MLIAKISLVLAFISFAGLAITGHLLFACLGPFFMLLALVKKLENSDAFKRFVAHITTCTAESVTRTWKRWHMTRPKTMLVLALICLMLFGVSRNLLFAWLSPFFFLLAIIFVLESGEAVKRILVNPTGLRALLTLETIFILITAVSVLRIFLFRKQSVWGPNPDWSRWYAASKEAELADFLFVLLPNLGAYLCSTVIRAYEKSPLVAELKSTPFWMLKRVANWLFVLSNVAILILIGYGNLTRPTFFR